MSVAFLTAVAFLIAVLVLAEFAWLREAAEEKARSRMDDRTKSRPEPRSHPANFAPREAATASVAGPERSAPERWPSPIGGAPTEHNHSSSTMDRI